jgi:hypothetical protein
VNGNWALQTTSQDGTTDIGGGDFTTTGSAVTGILHFLNSSCYYDASTGNSVLYNIPMTGNISSAGDLTLTSGPVNGQVLTIAGVWTSSALTGGTYKVAGGCANGDAGTITGYAAPPVSGTYSGTFVSVSGVQIKTMVTLTQTGPNSNGMYGAWGTATFTGSPCFSSGNIDPADTTADLIIGNFVQVRIFTGNGLVLFQGTGDPTATVITGTYSITGGSPGCAGDSGSGTVSKS